MEHQDGRSEACAAVLRVLGREPLALKEIAWRAGFSWESVRWALNRLLALGKVERKVFPGGAEHRWCYVWTAREENDMKTDRTAKPGADG